MDVARHLERIGDHAAGIAEAVVYLIDGQIIRHSRESAGRGAFAEPRDQPRNPSPRHSSRKGRGGKQRMPSQGVIANARVLCASGARLAGVKEQGDAGPARGDAIGPGDEERPASLAVLARGRSRIALAKLATVIRSPSSAG